MLSHSFQEQSHSSAVYSVTRQNEKSYRSKLSTLQEASIQGTSFHMDLGFVRCAGPNNLQERSTTQWCTTTRNHYHQKPNGFSSYLRAFLLKVKDPPAAGIDQFLSKDGKAMHGMITTNPRNCYTNPRPSTPYAAIDYISKTNMGTTQTHQGTTH
jgi:hypothetical protein